MPRKKDIIFVPAKNVRGARREWKKEGLMKYWELEKVRLAKKSEYPYERTHGYKTYVLEIRQKKEIKQSEKPKKKKPMRLIDTSKITGR